MGSLCRPGRGLGALGGCAAGRSILQGRHPRRRLYDTVCIRMYQLEGRETVNESADNLS